MSCNLSDWESRQQTSDEWCKGFTHFEFVNPPFLQCFNASWPLWQPIPSLNFRCWYAHEFAHLDHMIFWLYCLNHIISFLVHVWLSETFCTGQQWGSHKEHYNTSSNFWNNWSGRIISKGFTTFLKTEKVFTNISAKIVSTLINN